MSEGPGRTRLGDLARVETGSSVSIAGRVTSVDLDDAARRVVLVEDDTGLVRVDAEGLDVPLGAWIRAEGRWDGRGVVATSLVPVHVGRAPFPVVAGEWVRLHRDGRRRLHRLEQRAAVLRSIRRFFEGEGFLEVETPLAVPSPGLDLHLDAFRAIGDGDERWLVTSPEYQMKRLLAGGLERIFQVCRCFRRGERGARHEPEFTMLEWYRALEDADAVMRDTEALVARVALEVTGSTRLVGADGAPLDLAPPWERLRVEDAFRRHAGVEMDALVEDEDRFFLVLAETIEPQLGRGRPTFLTHWPLSMASLARAIPGASPPRADRFEAYVNGVELCNGFGELVDPEEQRRRLERDQATRRARGLPVYPLDERFLGALEEGMPPSGGNALGVDRLVMLVTGEASIDDVVAFGHARV